MNNVAADDGVVGPVGAFDEDVGLDALDDGGGREVVEDEDGVDARQGGEQLRAYADEEPSIFALAAAIGYAFARVHHPFVDGNKRVGAHAGIVFLVINDVEPEFSSTELTGVTLGIARGELSAEALAIWLRQRSRQRAS